MTIAISQMYDIIGKKEQRMTDHNIPVNVYRALHLGSGEVHYFVGHYDEEKGLYIPPRVAPKKKVIGHENRPSSFSTFSEAIAYKGYTDYKVASQAAYFKYERSVLSPGGWNKKLGEGYTPWFPKRKGRKNRGL